MLYLNELSPYAVPGLKRREDILKTPATINRLVTKCCEFMGVDEATVKKVSRKRAIKDTRMIIMYVLYYKGFTLKTIGDAFEKDHTTVIHARQRIADFIKIYPDFKQRVDDLRKHINELY